MFSSPFFFGIFLALILCSYCSKQESNHAVKVNSILGEIQDRVVGGVVATISEYPFLVSLQFFKDGNVTHVCGAVILDKTFILTAAHCVCEANNEKLLPTGTFRIAAGETYNDEADKMYKVSRSFRHADYVSLTGKRDIGLLKLKETIEFSPTIKPAVLADPNKFNISKKEEFYDDCTVAGWGKTSEDEPYSDRLLQVKLPLISIDSCQEHLSRDEIDIDQMCTMDESGGKDVCGGDSGGSLVCNGTVVGLVSWGIGCARPNIPGVYTRVSAYSEWIETTKELALLAAGQMLISDLITFIFYLQLVLCVQIS